MLNWKAKLQSPETPSVTTLVPSGVPTSSLLSFPVVKRASLRKGGKLSKLKPASQSCSAPRPHSYLTSVLHKETAANDSSNPVDTGDVVLGNSFSGQKLAASNPCAKMKEVASASEQPENAQSDACGFSVS